MEGVASIALQSQLKKFASVEVTIDGEASRVLQGILDGVVVRGRGWQSPLGLSARLLEVRDPKSCPFLWRLAHSYSVGVKEHSGQAFDRLHLTPMMFEPNGSVDITQGRQSRELAVPENQAQVAVERAEGNVLPVP